MPADRRAHQAVAAAVLAGILPPVTTQKCLGCGQPAAVYHHNLGYAKEHWLRVSPLCRKCHRARHSGPRRRPPISVEGKVRFTVALPQEMYRDLVKAAEVDHRSLNSALTIAAEWYIRIMAPTKRSAYTASYGTNPSTLREAAAEPAGPGPAPAPEQSR